MNQGGTVSLPSHGKLRCNQCSKLFTKHYVEIKDGMPYCICGCKAWFASKTTIWEWIGFALGLRKDGDVSALYSVDTKLGGNTEYMTKAVVSEDKKNEQQSQ